MANSVLIRRDIVDELGADMLESPEELLELCKLARYAGLPYSIQRTYADWPFYVDRDSLTICDGETFSAYVDFPVFEQDLAALAPFGEAGVARLILQNEEMERFMREWDELAAIYPFAPYAECEFADDIEKIQFAP